MRKIGIQILIVLLVLSTFPTNLKAESIIDSIETEEIAIILSDEVDGVVELLDVETKELILEIPDDSEITVIEIIDEDYVLIQYEPVDVDEYVEGELVEGLVHIQNVFSEEEAEELRSAREELNEGLESEVEADNLVVPETTVDENDEPEVSSNKQSEMKITNSFLPHSISSVVPDQSTKGSATSRLGHIRSANVDIYRELGATTSFKAGSEYTNAVYYIKRQAKVGNDTYYLLSTRPSAKDGVLGWAKSSDLSTHPHAGIDKRPKIFAIKGNGKATTKAWGGRKDTVHSSMATLKDRALHVDLTEKVGNNTWYRGKIDGQGPTVWLHSSYLVESKQSSTSLLGHIRNANVDIYRNLGGTSFKAGSNYTNAVYYIKRQAIVGKTTYYLLSTQPSATSGLLGWAKSSDLSTHRHVGVDKRAKSFLIKGNGKATTKAWGGNKDTVFPDMKKYKNQVFEVHLTEKVGNNTWYRGRLAGKTVWLHSSYVVDANLKRISRLGHIRSGNVTIYEELGGKNFKAGSTYTNAVYYIKAEANYRGQRYYLLSNNPSSSSGVVGWARVSDLSTHAHVGVDKKAKTLYVKGNGKATSKAWGGNKDAVYPNLSKYKNQQFRVNLTEKVGNNTWYRGMLDGKQVWLHSSYVHTPQVSSTSRLGHIRSASVDIYRQLGGTSFKAGSEYTNAVYYIKRQAVFGSGGPDATYYLLSKNPSDKTGLVGWAKASDLSTHPHVSVNKTPRVLIIKNNVKSYTKAWGGSKDLAYNDMSQFEGANFHVNLTEKVGNNTWYRGKINNSGGNIWFHSSNVATMHRSSTNYNLTLNQAINIQTGRTPTISKSGKWVSATRNEVSQYMNPASYINHPEQRFQFLVLNKPSGATVAAMNRYLAGRGVLANKGQQFYDAAKKNNINDLYAIAHARLETGNGKSLLSNGSIEVGTLGPNKWYVQVNSSKPTYHIAEYKDSKWSATNTSVATRLSAKNIRKTYNMFGIGAFDSNPNVYGSVEAYKQGWDTANKAIAGGITWIDNGYINNEYGQNTLYKMRWNPKMSEGAAWKQYATDVAWAHKQAKLIADMYQNVEGINSYYFDVPKYN